MMIPLYRNIRKRRLELGLTQAELAARTHYAGPSAISKIERGLFDLTQSRIVCFASALDTDPAVLMGWITSDKETPQGHEGNAKEPPE